MATLGKTSVGSNATNTGWAGYFEFTAPVTATENGTIDSIVMRLNGVGGTDQVSRGVVLVGNTLAAATLLALGAEVTVLAGAAVALKVSTAASEAFTTGQKLWFGRLAGPAGAGSGMYADVGASGSSYYIAMTYPTVPADVSTAAPHVDVLDIYINYTAAASGPPVNTVAPAVTGTTTVGQTLTSDTGTWTDGTPTFTYQWQRDVGGNGAFSNIGSATSSTYVLVDADDGNKVRCVVTDTDENGVASANSNVVGAVAEPKPTNSVAPVATGSPNVANTVSASTGTWTHQGGSLATYQFQWQDSANGSTGWANIAAAASASYSIPVGELNKYLRCNVTAHNSGGDAASATASNVLGPVAAALPSSPSTAAPILATQLYYYS